MDSLWIKLNNIYKVKQFVADCSALDLDLEVVAGEHIANAKSLLGVLSLPLSSPLELRANCESESQAVLLKPLEKYKV